MLFKFLINGTSVEFEEDVEDVINKLLYDDDFTAEFFETAIRENRLTEFGLYSDQAENLEITRCVMESDFSGGSSDKSSPLIWINRRPTEIDNMATDYLLDLREKYANLFDDKKNTKMSVWQKVAEQMLKNGFNVGNRKDGAEKCRQKFANLQKAYVNYIQHCNKTGAERKESPPYYEKLHSLLGTKHKFYPVRTEDTLSCPTENSCLQSASSMNLSQAESTCTEESAENSEDLTVSDETGRFSKRAKRLRPSPHEALINTINGISNSTIAAIVESNSKLRTELREQNVLLKQQFEQRESLLNAFKEIVTALKK